MLYLIIACEISFWVLLLLGLVVRYLTPARRLGLALLACAPAVDLVLLVASTISARSGHPMGLGHAIAPVYLGFSVTYGHVLVNWADTRFAHRFAGGPVPVRPTGRVYTRNCWRDVRRTALAAVITSLLTAAMIRLAGTEQATSVLGSNYRWMVLILGLDTLWAVSYTIWPRKAEPSAAADAEHRDEAPALQR